MHVYAYLDGVLELEQWREPARRDCARVADDDQHAGILVLQSHVVACHLDRGRRQQISQCACAAREAAFFARQRLWGVRAAALLETQTEHGGYTTTSSGDAARTARVV